MGRKEDVDTRYYIDIDLKNKKIISWNYGQKDQIQQELNNQFHQRVFITKGQYNKLECKYKLIS